MPFQKLNGKQEQVLLYLYEFRNAAERGVPPDPRITLQGMAEGTGLSITDVSNEVQDLKGKALVRSVRIGSKYYHYLTLKSMGELQKIQCRVLRFNLSESGFGVGYEKTETKGGSAK